MDDSLAGKVAAELAITNWTLVGRARNWIVGRGNMATDHVLASAYAPGVAGRDLLDVEVREQASSLVTLALQAYASAAAKAERGLPGGSLVVARSVSLKGLDILLVENFGGDIPVPLSVALPSGVGFTPWSDARLAALAGAIAWQQRPFVKAGLGHFNITPQTVVRTASGHCYCAAGLPPENALIDMCKREDVANLNGYCAPELSDRTLGTLSLSADVYSASALLFHLATNSPPPKWEDRVRPGTADAPFAALAGRDANLVDAIVAGLNLDAEERPADLMEWSQRACACIGGAPQSDLIEPWFEGPETNEIRRINLDKAAVDPSAERHLDPNDPGEVRTGGRSGHDIRRNAVTRSGGFGVRQSIWWLLLIAFLMLGSVAAWLMWAMLAPARAPDAATMTLPSGADSSAADDRPAPMQVRWPNGLTVNVAPFVGQFCTQQEQNCLYSSMAIRTETVDGKLRFRIEGISDAYQFDIDRSRPFDAQPMLYLVSQPHRPVQRDGTRPPLAASPHSLQITASDLGRDGTVRHGDRLEIRWSDSPASEIYIRCRDNCSPRPELQSAAEPSLPAKATDANIDGGSPSIAVPSDAARLEEVKQ